jgi:hypothetical protein
VRAMQKFSESTGCGLELLSLRRESEGRRRGSVEDVAEIIYRLIRAGEENPTRALNLTRSFQERERVRQTHHTEIQRREEQMFATLVRMIDIRNLYEPTTLTGLYVQQFDIKSLT